MQHATLQRLGLRDFVVLRHHLTSEWRAICAIKCLSSTVSSSMHLVIPIDLTEEQRQHVVSTCVECQVPVQTRTSQLSR